MSNTKSKSSKSSGAKRKGTRRTVVITGGTGGIGKEAATQIVKEGFDVIIIGRNKEKGEKARQEIEKQAKDATVRFISADLSEQSQLAALAETLQADLPHLDVLVNNVGHIFTKRKLTSDEIERTLALNHMCAYVLTHLLLPLLKKAPEARIVNVSSGMHHFGRWRPRDLHSKKNYNGWGAYGSAKLYNIIWSHQLARDLEKDGITVNVADPLMAMSENMDELLGFFGPMSKLWTEPFRLTLKNTMPIDRAAWPLTHLATSPKVKGETRKCMSPMKRWVRSSIPSYSHRKAAVVEEFSRALMKVAVPA